MAEIESLKARALVARQFRVESSVGHRVYTLQVPTAHELELAAASRAEGEVGMVEFFRQQLERALVGWAGVTEAAFTDNADDHAVVGFCPELVPLLLDAQPADAEQLRAALIDALAKRRERIEAAAKN